MEKSQPDNNAIHKTADFFAHSPDSVNSMLTAAMDTLRKDNSIYPFISKFIEKRGLPVWNKASGFYREGNPVFKVPVREGQKRKITGYVTIVINNGHPTYDWTPRGAIVDGEVSETIETIIWGYEKRVFGKAHTDGGARIETKMLPASKLGNEMSEMVEGLSCHRFCYDGGCSEWECEDEDGGGGGGGGSWGWGDDGGDDDDGWRDDDGDDDGGGGGGGGWKGGEDDSKENDDPKCENNAANIPFPGLIVPDDENDDPYSECVKEERDDGSENSFLGDIDASDLANHPKANCIYGRLSNANSMENIISEFAGENTNYDLDIKVESLKDDKNGNPRLGTTRANFDSSDPIEIIINSRYLNRVSNSIIATTFLHEALHAELLRKVRSIGGYGNLNESNFPGLYDYWIRHGKNSQHEQMAAHYLSTLSYGIAEFDNFSKQKNYYESLALKAGLEGTTTWDDLDPKRQSQANSDFNNEINNGNYNCK